METFAILVLIAIMLFACNEMTKNRVKTQYEDSRNPAFEKLGIKNNIIYSNNVEYLGGCPYITQNVKCYIDQLDNNNLVLYTWKYAKKLQYTLLEKEHIKSIQLIDKTQIINNPKLSSILLFGIAGLAINNKDKHENYYINIEYKNTNILLGCKTKADVTNLNLKEKATQIYSNLNKCILNA